MNTESIITSFKLLRTTDQSPAAEAIRKMFYEHFRQTVYVNLQRNPDIFSLPKHKKLAESLPHLY